ncbi:sugar ABC transporter substrate-binding protein [Aestuariibacter salexigens]|uniref:sugar ABC transporter substrate-binding protein n=1 Tax=Aestuariibacter salexigens TaxID=226010 RepID=UPI00041F91F6|nr:extracellular solute-binding protein [Aestuariibacter salexigens]
MDRLSLKVILAILALGISNMAISRTNSAAQSINVWCASADFIPALTEFSAAFERANPDISVNLLSLPNEEMKTSVIRAVRAGRGPDIVIISSDNTALQEVMKLSELPKDEAVKDLAPELHEALLHKGRNYGLPLYQHNRLMMFYNKQLVNQPVKSLEGLMQQASAWRQRNILPLGIHPQEPYWFMHFVTYFQPELINQQDINESRQAITDALVLYKRLIDQNVIDDACTYDCVLTQFLDNRVAYAINGNWAYRHIVNEMGDKVGVIPFPSYQGKPMRALSSISVMTFPNNSWFGSNRQNVRAFSRFLRSAEVQQQLFEVSYLIPFHQRVVEGLTNNRLFTQQWVLSSENVVMQPTATSVTIWNGVEKAVNLYLNGHVDAKEATTYMLKVVERDRDKLMRGQ